MRKLLLLLVSLAFAASPALAQSSDPSDHFLTAYMAYQKGEKAENSGSFSSALTAYKQAVSTLDNITQRWPNWNPPIVKHRRDRASEAMSRVQPKIGKGGERPSEEEIAGPLPGGLPLMPDITPPELAPVEATPRVSTGDDPIEQIQTRLKALQSDLERTRNRLAQSEEEKRDLAAKLEQTVKHAQASADMQARLQTRADRAEEALMKAEADGAKSSELTKTLRAELDGIRKQLREVQIDREAAEELRLQTADRLSMANQKVASISQERDTAKRLSADVPGRIASMQKEIDKVLKEKNDLTVRLAKTEESLRLVSKERDDALVQIDRMKEAQKQVDKLLADNTALMAKLTAAEKTITQFKADGAKKDEQIASLKKEVSSVTQQLAEAKQQSANYQAQMAEVQSKLDAQAKELAQVKTESAQSAEERKKLALENKLLRGIVIRQQTEQARRDQTKKLVLGELAKLEIQSKSLLQQIDYLGQPVVKLTPEERRLFKQPQIEISDVEVSIAAPKDTVSESATAPPVLTPAPNPPPAPAVAETKPEANPAPAAESKPEPAKTPGTKPAEPKPAADAKPAAPEQKPPLSLDTGIVPDAGKPAMELAKADVPTPSLTKPAPEGDLPSKEPGEKPADAAPAVETSTTPNVPPDLAGLAREGKDQFDRGNYREAEKLYEKILAKAPNNLYALSNLGVVRFRAGKLRLAEEAFKKAIAVAPEDAFSHCTLGIVYYSQGKYDEAVNELTKALAINPKNATAHNYLGITASQKGWQEAAQKELETATALDPNYADAFFNLAVVYATQQPPNKENARKHYKRATELGAEPDSALEQLIK